jgi:hypothetical protein
MKKLLVLVIALMVVFAVTAQENKVQKQPKSYLMISAGPSFPAGDFASKSEENWNAGYAKTGFNINVLYGINLAKFTAIEVMAIYGNHGVDNSFFAGTDAKLDHYQYYGLMAGPAFIQSGGEVDFSARFLAGFTNANSPKLVNEGETIMTEDWAGVFAWSAGADVKYNFNRKVFFLLKTDYSEMRPEFSVIVDGTRFFETRRMGMVHVNLGAGIRF